MGSDNRHPGAWRPGRGFRDAEMQANALRAAAAVWATGGPVRCAGRRRDGAACTAPVVRGHRFCQHHGGPDLAAFLSQRRADRMRRGKLTASQARRLERRRYVNAIREQWRADPWAPGVTLALGPEQEDALHQALAWRGYEAQTMPPAVLDWLRWRWRRAFLDGRHQAGLWDAALAGLPARLRGAGTPPLGWTPTAPSDAPEHLIYVWTAPGPWSKRRRLDRPAAASAQPKARGSRPLPVMSAEDAHRAVRALIEHQDALRVALDGYHSPHARLWLALALDRLATGEATHADWMAAREDARRLDAAA